ncbi:GTP-binding protein [Tardisphaera miroshnichenkoae]
MEIKGMQQESDNGNVEYKLKISPLDHDRFLELATQMLYRLNEGGGEAFYELGLSDDGQPIGLPQAELEESLANMKRLCDFIGADFRVVNSERGSKGDVLELHVTRKKKGEEPVSVNVAFLGNVDAGKSTLKGVLISNELDNGNGKAMEKVARYLHEIKSRRTSSVAVHALGFDEQGRAVNETLPHYDEAEIFLKSRKMVFIIDLAGHERYIKTTLAGIMGHSPDYAAIIVAANAGTVGTFKEHLGIALALNLPVFCVITKIDLSPAEITQRTLAEVEHYLKLPGVSKIPFLVKTKGDVVIAAKNMPYGRVVPMFMVSNVDGRGIDLIKEFLELIPPRIKWVERDNYPFMAYIDEKFNVTGVGLVVSGLVEQGKVKSETLLEIGPFADGSFRKVRVKSIQTNRVFADEVCAGSDAAFALTGVDYSEVRKGMILADPSLAPRASKGFTARIRVLHHPTTIRVGYTPVVHIHTIRQAARITKMSKEALRSGDVDQVEMLFTQRPEFVKVGDTFIFREGRARGLGIVLSLIH